MKRDAILDRLCGFGACAGGMALAERVAPELLEQFAALLVSDIPAALRLAATVPGAGGFAGWSVGRLAPLHDLSGANLSDADLSCADLCGANLVDTNLRSANLIGANLVGANLRSAYLIGADLVDTNLSGADLSGANLSGANLSDADLSYANLRGANLRGANLRGAYLRGANLNRAVGLTRTVRRETAE